MAEKKIRVHVRDITTSEEGILRHVVQSPALFLYVHARFEWIFPPLLRSPSGYSYKKISNHNLSIIMKKIHFFLPSGTYLRYTTFKTGLKWC